MTHFRSGLLVERSRCDCCRGNNHVTFVPDAVCLELHEVFCLLWPRIPRYLPASSCAVATASRSPSLFSNSSSTPVKLDRLPHQLHLPGDVMVFSSTVIVVPYVVIGKLYLHGCVPPVPVGICYLLQPVSCFSLASKPIFCRNNQASTCLRKRGGASFITINVHCMCFVPCAPIALGPSIGTCIRASVPPHHFFRVMLGPIPYLPVVRNGTVAVLILPLTQYVAAMPKLV